MEDLYAEPSHDKGRMQRKRSNSSDEISPSKIKARRSMANDDFFLTPSSDFPLGVGSRRMLDSRETGGLAFGGLSEIDDLTVRQS